MKAKNSIFKAIQNIVAENCYISPESIIQESRKREIIDAKHIFRYELMRRFQNTSEIGRISGEFNHSTMINSKKKYEELFQTDEAFRNKAMKCEEAIRRYESISFGKTEMETDYEPFIVLIRMIEAGHKNSDLLMNLTRCKKRINYIAGFKYFDV